MSSLALSNLAAQTQRAAHAQTRGASQLRRRWMHQALRKQGIMMPALSPFMTEGTVTRWNKKEGESFQAGDLLLQIENEVGMVDVEAMAPGILGKILTPDGTNHVPVESVIAIVARDASELASIQSQSLAPTPPPFTPSPMPPSSPRYPDSAQFKHPMMSPHTPTMSPRTPSLFEMHTMGMGHRSAHVGGPRGARPAMLNLSLEEAPRSPRTPIPAGSDHIEQTDPSGDVDTPVAMTPFTAADISYPKTGGGVAQETQMDGAAIRRMIVANLSASRAMEVEEFL